MIVVNARFLTQQTTGVQRYAAEIGRRLKKLVPDIVFVSPHNTFHNELANHLETQRIGRFKGHLWEQYSLPRFLRRQKDRPLLVNLANTAPLYYRPKIVTIHDLAFMRNSAWYGRRFNFYYKTLIPRIAKTSVKVVTDSLFSKKEIMQLLHLHDARVEVVPCAVSESILAASKTGLTNAHGDYILAASSPSPRKNIKRIVEAFERLKHPNLKLLIVGSDNGSVFGRKFQDMIQPGENVIFLGYASDAELARLYTHAKLLIFASLYEGFGIPPLEAMACGCPCLVSNTSSLPEVCGDAALYCDPYDVADITARMKSLLNDEGLRRQYIARGRERVRKFSWDESAKKLVGIINSLLI